MLTRGWILGLILALAGAGVCVLLGRWQYHRYETKHAAEDLVSRNYEAAAVPVHDILPERTTALPADKQWRPVTVHGSYCDKPQCDLYVRGRVQDGSVGFLQLSSFITQEGTLLVMRGWVPEQERHSVPAERPPRPRGPSEITVRLRPVEPEVAGRQNLPGQVQTITPSQVASVLPSDIPALFTGAYGDIVSENPAVKPMPVPLPKPHVDLGPHLSYAGQWWIFALFFPAAWVWAARRHLLDRAEDERTGSRRTDAHEPVMGKHPASDRETEQDSAHGRDLPHDAGPQSGTLPTAARRAQTARPTHYRAAPRRRSRDEEEEDALVDERWR
ncbi:SURF1 family cytochrome oxidase biogenesis protein [Devriesea agamarum]|uniref:SURF1 family cytochrome oxidase biogenesis protein n=1 Tax=Devriesea agamarum TaxID=472569 RepID=UPI00071D4F16|nr:SURF1 family protein [Devriesea agamarum]